MCNYGITEMPDQKQRIPSAAKLHEQTYFHARMKEITEQDKAFDAIVVRAAASLEAKTKRKKAAKSREDNNKATKFQGRKGSR